MLESNLSWARRRRMWLVAGALVVAVVVVVVLITVPGNGLMTPDRVVTGQDISLASDDLRDVRIDEATGTAYFSYLANGRRRLAAYKAGSDTPLWTADRPGTYVGTGEGLVLTSSGDSLSALDSQTGQRLWTQSQLPLYGGTIHPGGYISASLSKDNVIAGVAVLDARTGQLKWKLDHPGRDRVMSIPGTTDMLHYESGSRLRRLELATGKELMSADISAYVTGATSTNLTLAGDAVLLLVEQGGSPSTGGSLKGLVFGLADLRPRWEHEGRVTGIADDLFYAGSSKTGRQVLDAQGRELWRPEEEVQIGRTGSTWGYVKFFGEAGDDKPAETDLYTYVDLRTGERLAGDSREQAWFDTSGVLQMYRGRSPQYWFLSLPEGDTTNLGDLPVVWQDCAYSRSYIACYDHDGKPGMWRYRD